MPRCRGFANCLALAGLCLATPSGAQLLPSGVELQGAFIGDLIRVADGGAERRTDFLWNVDLQLGLDGDELVGWPGTRLYLYALGNGGGDPSSAVGDFQGADNIEAPDTWKLYEAWLEQSLLDGSLSVLAGLYDVNSEFDVIQSAEAFIHSSFGMGGDLGTAGRNGPSAFPTTSLGVRVKVRPRNDLYLQAAALDGLPGDPDDPTGTHLILDADDGLLLTGEVAYLRAPPDPDEAGAPPSGGPDHPAGEEEAELVEMDRRPSRRRIGRAHAIPYDVKLALGAWGFTRNGANFETSGGAPPEDRSSYGVYVLADVHLTGRRSQRKGLRAFGRAGFSDGDSNRIGAYLGAGLVYAGLLPDRSEDELGLGVAAAKSSSEFLEAQERAGRDFDPWEVAVEATYRIFLSEGVSIQPDIQYVFNPGLQSGLPDALVLGIRGGVAF